MAGHRRGSGRPLRSETRATNRNRQLRERLAGAATPEQRVAAATDYLRGALRHASPAEAEHVAAEVVRRLIHAGERLLKGGHR